MVELRDGYLDHGHDCWYATMRFRLPTGNDEERVAVIARDNPAKGTNALLTRCLVAVMDGSDQMPVNRQEAVGTKLLSDLTMGDRLLIEQAFREQMPGLDLSREVDCETCGRAIRTSLDMTSFFTPG